MISEVMTSCLVLFWNRGTHLSSDSRFPIVLNTDSYSNIWCFVFFYLLNKYNLHNIPLVMTDRGGQITYHGPGQAIIYFMLDLKKNNVSIKALVKYIEQTCINQLQTYGIKSYMKPET